MEKSCCDLKLEMSSSVEFYMEIIKSSGINENVLAIIAGLLLVILTAVIWKLVTSSSIKRTGILLVGLSDAGKSYLFTRLVSGTAIDTLTSLKENKAAYKIEGGKSSLTLVDLPGHEAIRYQYLGKFKETARGIIFVVDSESFQKNIKDVAEFLFQIFTDKSINKLAPSICIACNKQDRLMAKSKKVIKANLEKELNTVRKTQSAALTSTAGDGGQGIFLGVKGKDFEFQQLSKFKIEFLVCNAKSSEELEVNLDEVRSWVSSLI